MKQTAVEWLVERITKQHDKEFDLFYRAEIEQAKEMEKEQIEDAYWDGGQDIPLTEERCKQYYNETFKSE
jgi:vacuolar-type H+-ATPase subunit H